MVRKQLGDQLSKQVDDLNKQQVKSNKLANDQMVKDDAAAAAERLKTDKGYTDDTVQNSGVRRTKQEQDIKTVLTAQRQAFNENTTRAAGVRSLEERYAAAKIRDERQAYDEDSRRSLGAIRNTENEGNAEGLLSRLRSKFQDDFNRGNNSNATSLQKLATSFRTFGTIFKGLSAGATVFGGFQLLEDALGGIIALAPIAGATLAAIPAVIADVGVEALIVKGAFKGVGGAISDAFDPKKAKQFQDDLKNLAPAARSFVQEIAKAKGVLPNIQETFFSQQSVQKAGASVKTFFETIKGNFKTLVAANGDLFGKLFGDVTGTGAKQINDFLGNLAKTIRTITPGLSVLTTGFITFIDHVSQQLGGKGLNGILIDIGNFLSRVNVKQLFTDAAHAAAAFGAVFKDIGGTVGAVIKAFGGTDKLGAVFFKNIGGLFSEINKFANSAQGQTFLKEIVGTLNALSSFTDTAIKDFLGFLGGFLAGLYPAIKPFVTSMKTLVDTIFTPAFGKLLGQIASDFLNVATQIITQLTPAIKSLINFLVAHPKVMEGLAAGVLAIYLALKISKGVSAIASGIDSISTALAFFKNPKAITKGMGEVAAGETAMGTASGGAKAGLLGLGAATGPVAAGILLLAVNVLYLKKMFDIVQSMPIVKGAIFNRLKAALGLLGDAFTLTKNRILGTVSDMTHDITADLNKIAGFITKTVPGWFSTMASKIAGVFDDIRGNVHTWWSTVANFFTGQVEGFLTKTVPGWFSNMYHKISGTFDNIRSRVATWVNHDVKTVVSGVSGFVTSTVPGWFTTQYRNVSHNLDLTRNRIGTFITQDVEAVFSKAKGFILTTVPGWFATMQHDIISAVRVLVTSVQTIWSTITSIFYNPVKTVVNSVLGGLSKAFNTVDKALGGKHQISPPTIQAPGPNSKVPIPAHAGGGLIDPAYGGPTQDNVYLKSSNPTHPGIAVSGGEYVLKAASVAKIPLAYLNALNQYGDKAVSGDPSGIHIFDPRKQAYRVGGFVHGFASGGSVPAEARARVPGTLQFLKNIAQSGIPYILGANGPRGYDCSSLVGNVWARLTANPINRRYFVTGTEAGWLLGHGFAPGPDPTGFTVGLTSPPEHTVGMLGGHRFEAAHTGTTMRFDGGAANALNFAKVFHMIGMSGVGGSFGLPAALQAVSTAAKFASKFNGILGKVHWPDTGFTPEAKLVGPKTVADMAAVENPLIHQAVLAAQAAAASGFGAGSALGNVGGGQVDKWIAQASKFANIPASWVPGIETIIRRESNGNPNAINLSDINFLHGTPSRGLMQLVPGTFSRYHAAGTSGSITDPVANIAAGVNYIRSRYGDISHVQQANPNLPPRGYSAGGPVLVRDQGGAIPPGLSTVYNGTGRNEWVNDPNGPGHCEVTVILDGVDVTSRAHVTNNNDALAASLNRRTGR